MARRPLDWEELEGEPSRHTVKLDAGSLEFLHYLGCGDLSVGIREAARIARRTNAAAGELSADYLDRWKKAHPDEVAAYYAAYPDQVATPHRSKFADSASPRSLLSTPRATRGKRDVIPPVYTQSLPALPPPVLCTLEEQRANHAAELARIQAQQAQQAQAAAEDDDPRFAGWDD